MKFSFLDHLPLATVMTIGGGIVALIGYLNGDLTVLEALAAWGVVGIGGGQVGVARNGAGRGLRR
jgi:hypothetical protein